MHLHPLAAVDDTGLVLRDTARRNLLTVGALVGSGVALSGLYALAGVGLPCPFKLATGWSCPLCGGTRMGSALLHLDLGAALIYNPLALVGLVVVALVSLGWVVQVVRGQPPRLQAALGAAARRIPSSGWWAIGIGVSVAYMLLRNLVWPIPA